MGKKSGPKAPPPPDPYATADAQAGVNKETAIAQANLNRINQVTPEGTISYNQIGTNSDGTPQYQQVMQYSPEQQALYEQQNSIAQALGGLAQNNIGRVADAQSQTFNFDGMQPLQGVDFDPSKFNTNLGYSGPGVQQSYNSGGDIKYGFDQGGPLTSNVDVQGIARALGNTDFNQTSKAASDAVYGQLTSRLDPQFEQLATRERDRLINSGISENSDAYRRAMDDFGRQRTDAYNTAANQGVLTGLAAQQQGFNQALNEAQFVNQAQGQQFAQGMDNARLNNAAQGQLYEQNRGTAAFNNQAQQQANAQNAQQAGFNNTAQDQSFQQNLADKSFANTATQQQLGAMSGLAEFNNTLRQQQIGEASYLRNLPLNDIAALLGTGGGVQSPTFGPVSQVGLDSPDLMGAVYNTYNGQMQQYNQAQANRSAGLGSIFGLAGSLAPLAFSDIRLKENIKRIGTLANGIATYSFKYIGNKAQQFGVLAQEVLGIKPEAVGTSGGYLYVDYRKVWE